MKYVSIRFSPELLDEVRELAREEHRSVNGTVLEAIERYLRSRRGRQPKDASER